MTSNFKQRFMGKISSIPKQGVETLLQGRSNIQIYTNTTKSFKNSHNGHRQNTRQPTEQEQIQIQSAPFTEEKTPIHLPALGQRYTSQQGKYTNDKSSLKGLKGYLDRETNWFLDQNIRVSSPIITKSTSAYLLQTLKENLVRRLASKQLQSKRNNSFSKPIRLGGLGPNIGGDEWQTRNNKKQKALNYANMIRKIHRERKSNQNDDIKSKKSFNRITYRD